MRMTSRRVGDWTGEWRRVASLARGDNAQRRLPNAGLGARRAGAVTEEKDGEKANGTGFVDSIRTFRFVVR